MPMPFMFATGIENSYPTIRGGKERVDQMEKCGHYDHHRRDFDCVEELGIHFLRYGPPLHRTLLGPAQYDWSFADETFGELYRRRIVPIVDLCHFGVPDWLGSFQNPQFPDCFATYAQAFARRFPWVQLYTPVNEMYITALFSARYGWWNEQERSDRAFVTALKHVARANVLAMEAILAVRPGALFVQSESTEHFHASSPSAIPAAEVLNAQRFLSLDLNYGRQVESEMHEYLLDNGMTREEYRFFLGRGMQRHCIMGNDYYITNEHWVEEDGSTPPSDEVFGYSEITLQYYKRYRLPVMHTETNLRQGKNGDEAVHWLRKQWANVRHARRCGVPMVGFTWYSLTDQVDWDIALRESRGRVHPVGLYDLSRRIRPVGEAYRHLIRTWRAELPTRSICLTVPLDIPADWQPWSGLVPHGEGAADAQAAEDDDS